MRILTIFEFVTNSAVAVTDGFPADVRPSVTNAK
jgi:hypothetical protein